jgi:putative Holliday junction resolvase
MMEGRVLALDYGQKRTGLAITDPDRKFAFPLETVPTHQNGVTAFVLGEPKDLRNRPSSIAPKVDAFLKKLSSWFPGFPVYRIDERFSSTMATQSIIDSGVSKKGRRDKGLVDVTSATILLQSWIAAEEWRKTL